MCALHADADVTSAETNHSSSSTNSNTSSSTNSNTSNSTISCVTLVLAALSGGDAELPLPRDYEARVDACAFAAQCAASLLLDQVRP